MCCRKRRTSRSCCCSAFIPARYDSNILANAAWPGGTAADIWTFVTYALLHADWMHLLFNSVWLLAFGTPLARRFGAARFLAFCAVTAAAGALAHLMTHFGQMVPMVGRVRCDFRQRCQARCGLRFSAADR